MTNRFDSTSHPITQILKGKSRKHPLAEEGAHPKDRSWQLVLDSLVTRTDHGGLAVPDIDELTSFLLNTDPHVGFPSSPRLLRQCQDLIRSNDVLQVRRVVHGLSVRMRVSGSAPLSSVERSVFGAYCRARAYQEWTRANYLGTGPDNIGVREPSNNNDTSWGPMRRAVRSPDRSKHWELMRQVPPLRPEGLGIPMHFKTATSPLSTAGSWASSSREEGVAVDGGMLRYRDYYIARLEPTTHQFVNNSTNPFVSFRVQRYAIYQMFADSGC